MDYAFVLYHDLIVTAIFLTYALALKTNHNIVIYSWEGTLIVLVGFLRNTIVDQNGSHTR